MLIIIYFLINFYFSTIFDIIIIYFVLLFFLLQLLPKKRGVVMNSNKIVGKEIGTVSVHMYKDIETGSPFFYVDAENKDVLQLSHVIEKTLVNY